MLERTLSWMSSDRGYRTVGSAIAALTLILAVVCLGYSIPRPLIGPHSFRQTQNAISSYYSVKEHGTLVDNIMPVLGPPWNLPTELPLFQYLVGTIHWATTMPLDACGRVLSAMCWLACVATSLSLLRELGFGRQHLWIPTVFLLSSPQYLFWGAAYMMETMALLFSLVFLVTAIRCERTNYLTTGNSRVFWGWLAVAMGSGMLAALQKASTWVIAYGLLIMLVGWSAKSTGALRLIRTRAWLAPLFIGPYVAAKCWFAYGDALKSKNPFAKDMFVFSNPTFQKWNYGTFEQKISLETWEAIGRHMQEGLFVSIPPFRHHALLVLAVACLIAARRQIPFALFCGIAFMSGPVLFTNLYYVHNYYLTATGVWLLLGVSAALMGVAELNDRKHWARLVAIVATAVVGFAGFFAWANTYAVILKSLPTHAQLQEAWALPLQKLVPASRTVVILGDEWNPIWLYYAERKGIAWPERTLEEFPGPKMDESLALLGPNERLGAVVCMNQMMTAENKEKIVEVLTRWKISRNGIATPVGVIFPAEDLVQTKDQ